MEDEGGGPPLADRDVRLLARLLDRSLVLVTVLPAVLILTVGQPEPETNRIVSSVVNYAVLGSAVGLALTQWLLLSLRGQSLGKLALGIRIERTDGSPAGFLRTVVLRDWPFVAFAATGLLAVVDGLLIFGRDRRTLHDRLADTRVVYVDEEVS